MSDSNWDSYSEPPKKKGVPVWGKILIGCGTAMFLALVGCPLAGYWMLHSGFFTKGMVGAIGKPWDMMIGVADALQTDEAALKLYQDNPPLKKDFPTEEDFLKKAGLWRDKVTDLPRTLPPLMEQLKNNSSIAFQRAVIGTNSIEIGYDLPDSGRIHLRWEDGLLVKIEIE
jgi:hypothetical protein